MTKEDRIQIALGLLHKCIVCEATSPQGHYHILIKDEWCHVCVPCYCQSYSQNWLEDDDD